jgi:hypothetical protein
METTVTCAACGAPVGTEEVAQGLAVKVSGRLLCPLCLDRLPGDAKVLVNQMRALRGMAVTTYRFHSGRHPHLPLFTFTTAALVLAHRRRQVHGLDFDAPPLPPPGSRPRMPSATEAARGDRTGWIAVAGISILLITGVIWLFIPASQPPKPAPSVAELPVPTPLPEPAPPVQPPTRNAATELTGLETRLRSHPEQARSIADEAELLRDRLEPRMVALRNRADTLVRDALAVVEARKPQLPPPDSVQPKPPEPVLPEPVQPQPVPPPVQPIPVPQPQPQPQPDPTPALVDVPPVVPTAPVNPPKPATSVAVATDVIVVWPAGARPLVEPDGLPTRRDVPWPWPTGETIHAAVADSRLRPRRLALELRLAGISPVGGATVVMHPGKAERQEVAATWTDGIRTVGPLTIPLEGLRWQAVAIPAAGTDELDPEQLRLRLEDSKDLTEQRPFLVAGASTRWDAAPTVADHPVRLPLLLPPAFEAADGWSRFRKQLMQRAGKQIDERNFTCARAKVLLPFPKGQGADFRHALRVGLAGLLKLDSLPNGNPAELPDADKDFANPQAGWPDAGMDDLDRFPVLAFGWRALPWGDDEDLGRRIESLLGKMLTADRRLRRPAVLPVLLLGEIDRASTAERTAMDQRWEATALRLAGLGIPVVDLRSAQAEATTTAVQRAAARILVDALRQLDWLIKP